MLHFDSVVADLSQIKCFDNLYSLFFISTRYLSRVNLLTQTKVYRSMPHIDRQASDRVILLKKRNRDSSSQITNEYMKDLDECYLNNALNKNI